MKQKDKDRRIFISLGYESDRHLQDAMKPLEDDFHMYLI